MDLLTNLPTPIAFSITTIMILWSFGGGNIATFWQRSAGLALAMLILLFITPGYSLPTINSLLKKTFWSQKSTKSAGLAGLVIAIPFCVGLMILQWMPISSMPWISSYLKDLATPTWYAFLLLSLIVAPILELYWRGLIAPQWGTFTTAFLEGLIWGFAAQHVLFFIAGFASSAIVRLVIQKNYGIQGAMIAKAVWTAAILLTIAVI